MRYLHNGQGVFKKCPARNFSMHTHGNTGLLHGIIPSCCISLRHTQAYALSQVHTSSFRLTHGSWKAEDLDPDVHAHPHCLTLPEPRVNHVLHACCKYFASTFLSYGKTVFLSQNKQRIQQNQTKQTISHLFLSCILKKANSQKNHFRRQSI